MTHWIPRSSTSREQTAICNRRLRLSRAYNEGMEMSVDFVIITALKEEQEALMTKLPPVQRLPPTDDNVHVYHRTELPVTFSGGATGTYTLILLSIMGITREKATMFTTDALHRWHPPHLLLA